MTLKKVFNFTGTAIEKLPFPEKGYVTYKDEKHKFLQLYVTSKGVKTFFVRKRILNRDERIIIGSYPVKTVEMARNEAIILSGLIASGKDPIAEQRRNSLANLSFGDHFKDYLERYSKRHKATWKEDERDVNKYLKHWFKYRLADIRKADVQRLHERLLEESGLYQANKILIRIRAIFNKAIEWGWEGKNPTFGIKRYKEQSRDRFIQPVEMPFLLQAINEEPDKVIVDFLYMLLLTGARKTNTLTMQWQDIDWENSRWRIPLTKNGEPVTVPLVDRAVEILQKRKEIAQSDFVFSSKHSPEKHIPSPQKQWTHIRQIATIYRWLDVPALDIGIKQMHPDFNSLSPIQQLKAIETFASKEKIILPPTMMDIHLHDLRRTFGSYQAITGTSIHIIGKSLGHKGTQATQVYARLNIDPIRASVEKATQAMFG